MKWLLIVMTFNAAGIVEDNNFKEGAPTVAPRVEIIEFATKEECEITKQWFNLSGNAKSNCFQTNR